jgi:RimJ/RimL family protein N-acetyltransferase
VTVDEFDAILSDGRTIHVRPIHPDDSARLVAFHERLSPETVHMRFFSPHPELNEREVERFTHVDGRDRAALVATRGEEIVAVVRYERYPDSDEAEVAFVVDDAHQGRGIATLLLEDLAAIARRNGIIRFVAETLAENRRMIGVFRDAGFSTRTWLEHDVVHVSFPLAPDERFLQAMEGRERTADVASLRPILQPRSIAVLGATAGARRIHENLASGGFPGAIVAAEDWRDLVDPVDVAVVSVADAETPSAIEHCGSVGAGGVIVTSMQNGLGRLAHEYGMRLIGPASLGVVNTAPAVRMHALDGAVPVRAGRIGVFSQKPPAGIAVLERAAELGVGVSTFVSAGEKADVSGNDLLLFWEQDDATDVIALVIESFGNPRKFARIAQRVSRQKPIVALLHGDTVPADIAGVVIEHTGVVRVDTPEELLEVAQAPPPRPDWDSDDAPALDDIEPYLRRLRG